LGERPQGAGGQQAAEPEVSNEEVAGSIPLRVSLKNLGV